MKTRFFVLLAIVFPVLAIFGCGSDEEDVIQHLARKLDFSKKRDLNKELYTESPKGEERFVDVLLEVGYKTPPPSVLLVHVESQQQKRFDFPARMLGYQCLIYGREIERERKDSFSLAEFTKWD